MHKVNWFEIPVSNMDRAVEFYGALVGGILKSENFMGIPHAIFGSGPGNSIGALVQDPNNKPARDGNVVYFASEDIDAALARVKDLGAEILVPKTDIGAPGHIAVLRDSEGNRIGLHTPPG